MMEENKKSKHEIIIGYFGIVLALVAILIAWNANSQSQKAIDQSEKVFEWQKEQEEKKELVDIKLEAYLEFENVFLHDFKEVQIIDFSKEPPKMLNAWKGFYTYITLDILNNSLQPLTITSIASEQQLLLGVHSELSSKSIFMNDLVTEMKLPFTIQSKQSEKLYIRVPWLVDSELFSYLDQVEKNKMFDCKDFFATYNKIRFPDIKQKNWELENKGEYALLNLIGKQITNIVQINTNDLRNFLIRVDLANDTTITTNATYKIL